jgi:hypothetical protein
MGFILAVHTEQQLRESSFCCRWVLQNWVVFIWVAFFRCLWERRKNFRERREGRWGVVAREKRMGGEEREER